MNIAFIHSFQCEWLKKRRSLASWIIITGAFFTPLVIIVARLVEHDKLNLLYASDDFWKLLWKNSWESMAIFLLPSAVILFTSLITQIEYKNNAWKQVHTLPLKLTTIFLAKLAVIIIMVSQFFILFNIGIYLSAVIPYILLSGIPYPKTPIPYTIFLREDVLFFIDCLPIIALQYLLSLRYKNFLVSVGVGFILWVGAIASLSWKFGYIIPYTYCTFNYLKNSTNTKTPTPAVNIHYLAIGYFILFTIVSYILYINKKDKS